MSGAALRPTRGRDPLGLRRALGDRSLPFVVAAMALLAGLALGAAQGAGRFGERWREAATTVTVELPAGTDATAAAATLAGLPGVAGAVPLDPARMAALLRPWLGDDDAPLLPPLVELRRGAGAAATELEARVRGALPQARVTAQGGWVDRLLGLARTIQAIALLALALVGAVATATIGVAVRAGVAARRDQIAILHHLGGTDATIAGRFARRVALLAGGGGAIGAALVMPVLAMLGALGAPLLGAAPPARLDWAAVPFGGLLTLPVLAAALGWGVAQASVRAWLWRLP